MRVLIIGAGDVGLRLGHRLARAKHDVTVIEADAQKASRAQAQVDGRVVHGNGASIEVLAEARLEQANLVAAMTDSDEINLLSCQLAKKAGRLTTVARVRNPEFTDPDYPLTPQDMGADHVIHPEMEAATAIVNLLHAPYATYALELDQGKIQILGVRLDRSSPLVNRSLQNLNQNGFRADLRIVALNRAHRTLIPRGDDILMPGDQIFVVCDPEQREELVTLSGKHEHAIHNVMILGGGLVGEYVARQMGDDPHAKVKIIEEQEERAWKIAASLPNAMVIHGDGTDIDLLLEEGLDEMDAFVAATGDDGKNIITTLLARHSHVPHQISLVNRVDYLPIMPTIGLDTVVSKQLLTVNAVQRLVQRQQVASIASLPGINGQFVEYVAPDNCKITRNPLRDLRFPRNAIVGAVLHGDEVTIPTGDTQISSGDRVVVFMLPEVAGEVGRLFGR
jgi:trk system potassium uptake protein